MIIEPAIRRFDGGKREVILPTNSFIRPSPVTLEIDPLRTAILTVTNTSIDDGIYITYPTKSSF
jgi:hypothetical protein